MKAVARTAVYPQRLHLADDGRTTDEVGCEKKHDKWHQKEATIKLKTMQTHQKSAKRKDI